MLTLLDMSYDMADPWCAKVRPEILRSAAAKEQEMDNLFFMLASAGRSLRGSRYFDSLYISQELACQGHFLVFTIAARTPSTRVCKATGHRSGKNRLGGI